MKKSSSISKKKPVMRAVLILCLSLFVFGLVMTIHQAVQAAEGDEGSSISRDVASTAESSELLEMYREKKYKGAQDEEELKVSADLQTSSSAKKKSQEAEEGF
ncbi:hypothetical protein CIK05_03480 [Bdellovibrio sp. qaytius]|nr:hypothetical protein CIK05_03480 [Bdellovibrio sp. qaytius]